MYNCKELNSLIVLSLFEGELLGVVDKLYLDERLKKLCELEILSEEGIKLKLSTKNIYRVGKNAITIKNNQQLTLKEQQSNLCIAPIASKVYTINGEFLGVVQEISFNEKFATENILLDNGNTLDISDLASVGKNVLIFYKNKKTSVKKFTPNKQPKFVNRENVQMVKILPETIKSDEVKTAIVQDSNFLIGRICTKDIFNFNNE
jgi:uncharacterized protein YrrD